MRLFVSFVLMTLTLSLSVSPWSWANEWVVDSNTIALYHFDSLTDATQNGFDLTRNGNAILTDENLEWMDDPHGKALKISALGDQATVLIPDEMVLPGRSATSLTFDAWFYPIAYKAYGISNHQILSLYQSWDCGLEVRDGKWNSPPVPAMRAAAAIVVTDDQWQQGVSLNAWHFLRITYENDYVSVFLDGQLLEAGTTSFNMDRTSDWILTLGNFEGYLDEVRISNIVRTDSPPTVNLENQPPVIDAGLDQEIRIDHIADLRGQANDDGLIDVPLYTEWSTITGPGTVIFGNENSTETSVDFSEIGSYVLRLSADDGEFIAFDEVVITVVDMPEPSTLPFSIIVLPDTQAYSDYSPEKFTSQTQWIADHAEELNITFVLHEGDIVNHADEPLEWDNAAYSLSILNGITPYLLSVGNHDYDGERNSSAFNTTFPVSRYETMDSFGGVFEAGKLDNSYHLFSAGGVNFLTLSLEFGPRDDVLNWADSVISAYPNRRIILVTHAYLSGDGTRLDQGDDYNPHFYTLSDSINDGEEVWQALVKKHPNIDFVFSGHVRGIDGTGCAHAYRTDLGDYGNIVHQMVANYQDCYSGGDGYLRIITFDPVARKASVETYSPYLDSYLTDSNNEFVIQNLDFFGQGAVQNRPPVGKDQEIGVQENSSVEILLAATDADGDNLIYQIAVFPDHGTLSGTPPSVTYAPSEDYSGPDSFTFEVSDGKGGSDTAEISITVSPIHIGEEGDEFEGDENTIALYHFDNLTDTGQNGFDLTIEGEAQLTDENIGWMENPHGKALKVMDLGDQVTVSIPDTIVMPDSSLSPLTMEARFYPVSYKAYGVNNYQILTLYQSWDAGIEVRDGKWNSPRVPTVRAGKTTVATENQWEEGVSLNEWHALRITMDANLVEVYMDDQLMGSTANTLNAGRVTDWTLTLGNFEGYIDEVRISSIGR